MSGTMAEKVWRDHIVSKENGAPDLLYIDLHLVHSDEPQTFEGLRLAGRRVRPDLTIAIGPQHAHGQHRPADRGHASRRSTPCARMPGVPVSPAFPG